MSERSSEFKGERAKQPEKRELSRAETLANIAEKMTPLRRERLTRGLEALEAVFKRKDLSLDPLKQIDAIASARELLMMKEATRYNYVGSMYAPEKYQTNEEDRDELYRHAVLQQWPFVAVKNGERDEEGFALFVENFVRAERARISELEFASCALDDDWMPLENVRAIDVQLKQMANDARRRVESREPPELLQQFPDAMRSHIANNVAVIELTEGCSVRCTFCAFSAPGEVGTSLPFSDVAWLARRGPDSQFYYYATDPLDYHDSSSGVERTYEDVLAFTAGNHPFTSTAYPRSAKDVMRRTADRISRVSVSKMNRKRLQTDGFLAITEKGSIIPTHPDLARSIFGSASPAQALYNLIEEPTQLVSGKNLIRAHEDGHADGDAVGDSIACRNGVIFSPKKLRNTVRMMSTDQYPNGVAEVELDPERITRGTEEMNGLHARVKAGEVVKINELLACSVVRVFVNTYRPKPRTDLRGTTLTKAELSGYLSPIAVLVWDEKRKTVEAWSAMYDMVDGRIARFDREEAPREITEHNRSAVNGSNELDQQLYARQHNPRWTR